MSKDGQLQTRGTYVAGEIDGLSELYHENGQLQSEGPLNMGEECGEWIVEGEARTYPPCPPGLEDGN